MRAKRSIKDSLKEYLNWCVGRLLLGGSRDDTVRDMVDAISDEIASGGGGISQDQLDQTVQDITKSYSIADQTVLTNAESYTDQKIADVVDGSPEALDTLYELAKALGDDPNFATTVMDQIGQKLPTSTFEEFVENKAWTKDNLTKLSQLINDLTQFGLLLISDLDDPGVQLDHWTLGYFSSNTKRTIDPFTGFSGDRNSGFLILTDLLQIAIYKGTSSDIKNTIVYRTKLYPSNNWSNVTWRTVYTSTNLTPGNYVTKNNGSVTDKLNIESSTLQGNHMVGVDATNGIYLQTLDHFVNLLGDKLYLDNSEEFYNTSNLTSLSQLINDISSLKAGTRVASMDIDLTTMYSYLRYDLFDATTIGTKPTGITTGFLLTFSWDNGGWGAQIATPDGNIDGAIFLRTIKASGSDKVWGPWVSLYNTANLNLGDYVKKGEDGIITVSEPEVHNGTNTFNGQVVLGDGVGISNGGNQLLGKNESGDLEIGDGTLGVDIKADLVYRVDGDQRYLIYDEDILPNPLHELATITDLNNATDRGTYSFNSGATNTPPGMNGPGGWVLVMVNQTDKGKKTQICGGFDSNGNYRGLYTRYLPDNVNWSEWEPISGGGSSGESPVYYFPGDPSKLDSSASSTHITSTLGTASDLLDAFNNGKVFISKTVTFSGVQVPSDITYSLLKSEDPDTPTVFQIIMSTVVWGHYIEITIDFENNEYQFISNTINGIIGVNTTGTTN